MHSLFSSLVRAIKNFDVNRNEYLCPICSRLSNSVLPLSPGVSLLLPFCKAAAQQSFFAWADSAKKMAMNKVRERVSAQSRSQLHVFAHFQTLEELSDSAAKESKRATNSSDLPRLVLAVSVGGGGAVARRSARLAGAAATGTPELRQLPTRSPKLNSPMPEMVANMASTFSLNLLSVSWRKCEFS